MKRILVIDAHGDDALLGMGGVIALHAKHWGDQVRFLMLTDGASTQYPGDVEMAKRRQEEVLAANGVLGMSDVHQMGFADMKLDNVLHVELNAVIEKHIEEYRPQIVYCVHPDVNMDHQCVFRSSLVAVRPRPGCSVHKFVTYAPLSSTEWDVEPSPRPFSPNLFVNIEKTIEDKLAAMRVLGAELREYPHPRSLEGIRVFAACEGVRVGLHYAEPLCLMRQIDQANGNSS